LGFEEIKAALEFNIAQLQSDEEVDLRKCVLDLTEGFLELFNKFEGVLTRADKVAKMIDGIKSKAKKKKRILGDFYT